jgi:aspartyl protease family protein
MSMTANGPTRIWKVTLNSVRVGEVLINQVDAAVHETDMPIVLLGMSFLNRMEMKRDGQNMMLKKRF